MFFFRVCACLMYVPLISNPDPLVTQFYLLSEKMRAVDFDGKSEWLCIIRTH